LSPFSSNFEGIVSTDTWGKQMAEPPQIDSHFRTRAITRVPSVVLPACRITCKFDLGRATSRRERRRTAGQPSYLRIVIGLNSVAGHSRKHSRYYGSADPASKARGQLSGAQNLPESTCTHSVCNSIHGITSRGDKLGMSFSHDCGNVTFVTLRGTQLGGPAK